jgi:transposase-like protein
LQKGCCEVTKKNQRVKKKYPQSLREIAVVRLKSCENVTALAKELGVHRTLLYKWRERMENKEGELASGERKLRAEIRELKRVLAEKTLEADFFRGALQKIEARRQNKGISGGKASTPKSGS